jgi:HK97 family phage major capsid protein
MPKTARALVEEYQRIYERADSEGRDLTRDEMARVADLVDRAGEAKKLQDKIDEFGLDIGAAPSSNSTAGGPGDVFVNSAEFKAIQEADTRPQEWSIKPVEVIGPQLMLKGTLTTTGGGAGPGGGLVPPYWQPGVVRTLFQPLGVGDLFGQSTVATSQVRFVVEGTATSAATGVPEAGLKPESTLGFTETTEPVKKIAHLLPVSDEMLEDVSQLRGYLNERLTLMVRNEEETQLLRGSGGNNLVGMFSRAGVNTYTRAAADTNIEAVAKVIANTAGSANVYPTGIVMHPQNYLHGRLTRAGTAGEFLGGGPWGPAYGGNSTLVGDSMWGVPVVLHTGVGLGTALIGDFRESAHIWRRGGVTVEASSSHSDYFQRNLVALRGESRLALGVYRSTAFTAVSGLLS